VEENTRGQQKQNLDGVQIDVKCSMDFKAAYRFVVRFAEQNPDVIMRMAKIIETKQAKGYQVKLGGCSFPEHCNRFPCETLCCNADECDNGYCFRRS
jgi:hypothetical protein